MQEIDTSNGVIFPFYDQDTNMVYLCGKVCVFLCCLWQCDSIHLRRWTFASDLLSVPGIKFGMHQSCKELYVAWQWNVASGKRKWNDASLRRDDGNSMDVWCETERKELKQVANRLYNCYSIIDWGHVIRKDDNDPSKGSPWLSVKLIRHRSLFVWGTGIRGLMRGMPTLSQVNQELLVVRDKVGRPQVSLG